jgi:hypothetical protein
VQVLVGGRRLATEDYEEHGPLAWFEGDVLCGTCIKTASGHGGKRSMALFELGEVVGTPAALDLLEEAGVDPASLLRRHSSGDWGDVPEADARENEFAVQGEYRVLSSYPVGESRVWIITEADRSATTIMLPGEYYSVRQKHWPYRRM